jgi:undecaprenyl-diphosphatase
MTAVTEIAAPARPRWWVVALVATAVAVACGLVAAGGDVPGWEESAFHAINDLPDWLRPVMWAFQLAGLLLVPLVVAVGAAVARKFRLVIALVALIPLKLFVEKLIVKQLVERQRPGTSICDGDATCANFRDVPLEGLSFVSGHAIIAWAVATLLWAYLPGRWRWLPVGVAVANSVARVYLGAHNPLDVVGGGAIGVAIGATLLILVGLLPVRLDSAPREPARV